jgi:signal transduction histidine kinase
MELHRIQWWLSAAMTVTATFFLCPSALAAQERPPRTVLTIHAGSQFFPANPVLDAAIREVLMSRPGMPIDYYTEYIETDRFGPVASAALVDYVRRKYEGRHLDVVIAMTNYALQFVLEHRDELFPDVPIVFAGIAVPDESVRSAGGGIAVVRIGSAYVETLKLALQLHPSTERVFVMARSGNQQNVEDAVRAQLSVFSRQVQLTFVERKAMEEVLEAIRAAPPQSIVLHLWQRGTETQEAPDPLGVARSVAEASPVPVYGTVDINIGTGIVGGVVRGTRETGIQVAEMALKILEGTRAQDIPIADTPLVPTFDWRQIKRWRIDPAALPPGSKILFFTPTVWETYRPYIIATILVLAAQLLAIAGLLVQRARRRRAEEMVLAREATIRTSYQRIRQLAGRLLNAQEMAQTSIARELHDGVCQELAGVSIAVDSLKNSSGSIQDAQTQQTLSKIHRETMGMFEGIRRLSHDLHPATLRLVGLPTALRAHCAEVEKRHAVQVQFTADGDFAGLHPDVALCFFRIAQESLRNGIKHGEARRLSVSLARSGDDVDMTVTDDGRGFDLNAVRTNGGGLGLVSIDERAYAIGGDVQIVSAPRLGTTIHVRAPAGSAQTVQ